MKYLAALLIITYVSLENVLGWVYPEKAVNYDVWLQYWEAKTKAYELMFCLFFFLMMKGNLKYFGLFGFCLSFASCIDKIILGKNTYLYSDVLIVAFSVAITWFVYDRDRRRI